MKRLWRELLGRFGSGRMRRILTFKSEQHWSQNPVKCSADVT